MTIFKLEENRTFRWEGSIAKPLILNNLLYTFIKKYADLFPLYRYEEIRRGMMNDVPKKISKLSL
jgi:hypothetical protein